MSDIYEGPLYETFGSTGSEPHSRQMRQEEPTEIPYAELHDGLKQVEIHIYGDDVNTLFIHVVATTQERADAVWQQTMGAVTPDWIEEVVHQ